ncbi:putative disease resistance RPP13-like protein 1 [Mangifera indica]|uniref:putative disease resistance RPP13-like protein 1 n=1 Tax=Mangifera indica TaxID=29780 RepID=UPI001CF9E344|nr:putative disease resistance RPP13-like protein 1 [Mangifera indica]
MVGASGSRIIITTRIEDVALTMGHVKPHNLGLLSGDDCWAIFEKHAFQNTKFCPHQTSNFIRKKVVEICKGLPLAARTLGGLLRCKQRESEWEDILNSNLWDLQDNTEILAVLKLSYNHLPSHLKRCFAYCAIFPKDYEFTEKELVFLWMAEGLIQPSKVKEEQEDAGTVYFQDLLARSIFQESGSRCSSKYIMHDLVNDLAQWASGETSFCLQDKSKVNVQSERLKTVRYLSYTCSMSNYINKFEVLHEATNLRTFLPKLLDTDNTTIIVSSELLSKFKKLRALFLSNHNVTELPDLIGDLRHLRYINLSGNKISSLPKSINLLLNLQILILRWCSNIKKLPSMGNLINLRHLDLEMVKLMEMPRGMESWKNLQTLSDFFVGKGSGSSLKVLRNLKFLCGKLRILELKNVTTGLKEEILSNKERLDELWLKWGYGHEDSRSEEVEKNVLDMLRPHKNLKELSIEGYGGTQFPTWLGDLSFSLTSLEKLKICECQKLQFLFEDREEIDTSSSLVMHRGNIDNTSTSLLKHLSISFCSSLMCLSPKGQLPKTFKHLECLKIKGCDSLICIVRGQLPSSLKQLSVENCENLQCLLDDREDGGIPFSSSVMHMEDIDSTNISQLEDLNISSCLSITCLSLKGQLPTTLKHLCISDCPSLSTLSSMGQLPVLKKIEVWFCSELKILFLQDQLPGALEYLCIWRCSKLELIAERLHDNRSLKDIFICDCENLKSMPDGLDSRRISIINCPNLVSFSGGRLSNSTLEVSIDTNGKLEALLSRNHSHSSVQNS